MCFGEWEKRSFLLNQIVLVRDPLCCPVDFIAPSVHKLLAAPVQFFHCSELVPFYELFFDIVKWGFDLAFFTGPVTGTCIQFCPQMLRHHQSLGIILDLILTLRIVFNDQCFWVIDQQFQCYTAQIIEQLLYGLINRGSIRFQGKTDSLLSGCGKDHCEAIHFPLTSSDHHGVL